MPAARYPQSSHNGVAGPGNKVQGVFVDVLADASLSAAIRHGSQAKDLVEYGAMNGNLLHLKVERWRT